MVIEERTSRALYRNQRVIREEYNIESPRFFRKLRLIAFRVDDYLELLSLIKRIAKKISEEGNRIHAKGTLTKPYGRKTLKTKETSLNLSHISD